MVEARSRVGGRLKGEILELGLDYPTTLPESSSLLQSTRKQQQQQRGKTRHKAKVGGGNGITNINSRSNNNNAGGDPNPDQSSNANNIATTRQHPIDVGGALIHGIENNPIHQITSRMGVPVHPVSSYCLLMDENGWPFDPKLDERTNNFFNECLDVAFALAEKDRNSKDSFGNLFEKVCREKSGNANRNGTASSSNDISNKNNNSVKKNGTKNIKSNKNNNWETPLLKWHRSNLELPSGASFYNLGHTWNQDEPFGFDGVHAAVEPSWKLVMERLAEGLNILGNSPVTDIRVVLPNGTTPLELKEETAAAIIVENKLPPPLMEDAIAAGNDRVKNDGNDNGNGNDNDDISNSKDDANETKRSLEPAITDQGKKNVIKVKQQKQQQKQPGSLVKGRTPKKTKNFFDSNVATRRVSRRQRNIDANVRRSSRSTKGVITRLEFDHEWDQNQARKRAKKSNANANTNANDTDSKQAVAAKNGESVQTGKAEEKIVDYEPSSMVQVTLRDGTVLEADALVCTLPLGVLKLPQNDPCHVRFVPSLGPIKNEAIQNLGCGLLNKCAISFPNVFWQDSDFLGQAESDYSYLVLNATKYTQKPILIFMYGGDFAKDVEGWTDQKIVEDCLEVLKKICGGAREFPAPVDYCITRWGKEEYARMAFTCIPPGVDGAATLRAIGQPIHDPILPEKPLIMFAGEHSTPYHPSTMHGAFLSGIREAYRFDLFMEPVLNNHIQFDDQIHVYKHTFATKRVYKKNPIVRRRNANAAAPVPAESKEGASSSLESMKNVINTTLSRSNNNMHSRRRRFGGMTLRSRPDTASLTAETTSVAGTSPRKSRKSMGAKSSTTLEIVTSAATRRSQRSLGSLRKSIQSVASPGSRWKNKNDDGDALLDEHGRAEKLKSERKKRADQQEDRTLLRALESYGRDCHSFLRSHILPVYGSTRKRSAKQISEKWRRLESLSGSVLSSNKSKNKNTKNDKQQKKGATHAHADLVQSWLAKNVVRDNWNTHFARIAADAATEAGSSKTAPESTATLRRSHRGAKRKIFFDGE